MTIWKAMRSSDISTCNRNGTEDSEKGVPTLDLVFKNQIGDNFEVNAFARNLLDPKIQRIRETETLGDIALSSYKRGINIAIQLKYNF